MKGSAMRYACNEKLSSCYKDMLDLSLRWLEKHGKGFLHFIRHYFIITTTITITTTIITTTIAITTTITTTTITITTTTITTTTATSTIITTKRLIVVDRSLEYCKIMKSLKNLRNNIVGSRCERAPYYQAGRLYLQLQCQQVYLLN
uniref:Uncharacterized protein n=1 Tax=Glossina pallidipes TaxID=7398 RepID=A0A1B0AJM5_GLOPL